MAAESTAKGLILYAEPPSKYVEVFEFTTLTRQSIRHTSLVRPSGQRSEIHTGGIMAAIPYPNPQEPGNAARATAQLNQIQILSQKYPQFRTKLEAAATRWRNAAAVAKALASKPTLGPVPKTEGMLIVTTDGTRFEDVTVTNVADDVVSFTHSAGVATVELQRLPPELQREFNYDPKRAEAAKLTRQQATAKPALASGAVGQPQSLSPTAPLRHGATTFTALMAAYGANNTDAIQEKSFQKDKCYFVGGGAFQPFFIAQIGDDFVLAANVLKKPWAVIVFENPSTLENLQMPTGSLARAVGRFVGFKALEMASGASERLPIFSCVGIEVIGGGFANTEASSSEQ